MTRNTFDFPCFAVTFYIAVPVAAHVEQRLGSYYFTDFVELAPFFSRKRVIVLEVGARNAFLEWPTHKQIYLPDDLVPFCSKVPDCANANAETSLSSMFII